MKINTFFRNKAVLSLILIYFILSQLYLIGSNYQLVKQFNLTKNYQVYSFNHILRQVHYRLLSRGTNLTP